MPVTRSMLRTLLPSTRSFRASVALSLLTVIASRGLSWGAVKVLPQDRQRKRWLPFRFVPNFFAFARQLWDTICEFPLEIRSQKRDTGFAGPYGFGCTIY